jgi:hypothetical protein
VKKRYTAEARISWLKNQSLLYRWTVFRKSSASSRPGRKGPSGANNRFRCGAGGVSSGGGIAGDVLLSLDPVNSSGEVTAASCSIFEGETRVELEPSAVEVPGRAIQISKFSIRKFNGCLYRFKHQEPSGTIYVIRKKKKRYLREAGRKPPEDIFKLCTPGSWCDVEGLGKPSRMERLH